MSVEAIASLADETAAILDEVNKNLTAAQRFQDKDLQPHAVWAKRETLAAEARTKAAQALAGIKSRAESAAATIAKKLESSRPRIAEDPAALIRAEQRWNYDVRPLMEAGAPVKSILRGASLDELLAIERFGVGHLRAAKLADGPDNPRELDPDELAVAVNNRLALVLPEDQRAAFEDGIRAADAAARMEQIYEVAADTISGRGRLPDDREAYARARTLAIQLRA